MEDPKSWILGPAYISRVLGPKYESRVASPRSRVALFWYTLDTFLYFDNVTKISILDFFSDLRSVYVTDIMIPFSKSLFSTQSSCLCWQCIGLHFENMETQGNLVKELHLSGYSSSRFKTFQICMR